MKSFSQYINEEKARKKSPPRENIAGADVESSYKTPSEIRDIQNKWAGDESISTDWGDRMNAATMAANRGAESMITREEEDITPGMAKERKKSSTIMTSIPSEIKAKEIHMQNPSGRQYTDDEIAKIMSAKGHPMTKQGAAWIAQNALEKLKKQLTGSELDPNRGQLGSEGGSSPTY